MYMNLCMYLYKYVYIRTVYIRTYEAAEKGTGATSCIYVCTYVYENVFTYIYG
jgi:hypothetical protein